MTAYSWTLPDALSITLPQLIVLFKAMQEWPPINTIVPILIRMARKDEKSKKDPLDKLRDVSGIDITQSKEASNFLRTLGIQVANG